MMRYLVKDVDPIFHSNPSCICDFVLPCSRYPQLLGSCC